jgi:hypothetical protein
MAVTAGSLATADWLVARGITTSASRWFCEIALGVAESVPPSRFQIGDDTRFQLHLYAEEWGFLAAHGQRVSWIRVTDRPWAQHDRDDFALHPMTPLLRDIGQLVREVERSCGVTFRRDRALVHCTFGDLETAAIRAWIADF